MSKKQKMMNSTILSGEAGRSMVEMLGVLAIMGVLSVGGIAGYTLAQNKHKANEILNEAFKRALIISTQILSGREPSLTEFKNNQVGGSEFSTDVFYDAGDSDFSIGFVEGKEPSEKICNHMKDTVKEKGNVELEDDCSLLTYKNDLTAWDESSDQSCSANQTKCVSDYQYACSNGQWESTGTHCPYGCNGSATLCAPNDCIENQVKCESGEVYVCRSFGEEGSHWVNEIHCLNGCDGNGCADECSEGDIKCEGSVAYLCRSAGGGGNYWSYGTSCPYGCNSSGTDCAYPECYSGQTKCVSGYQFACCGGQWNSSGTYCPYGCNSSGTACIPKCSDYDRKCESGYRLNCVSGRWYNSGMCVNGCNSNGTDCAACHCGQTICVSGYQYTCFNGLLGYERDYCPYGCNGNRCAECYSGQTKCESGYQFACSNGYWNSRGTRCPNGCDGSGYRCAECHSGQTKCESNTQYACSNGYWSYVRYCANGCDGSGNRCVDDCSSGQTKCESGYQFACSNGYWNSRGTRCPNGCNSSGTACIPVCSDGQTKCESGSALYTCSRGLWVLRICANGYNSSCTGCVDECSSGQTKCESGYQYGCSNGQWNSSGTRCPNGCSGDSCK